MGISGEESGLPLGRERVVEWTIRIGFARFFLALGSSEWMQAGVDVRRGRWTSPRLARAKSGWSWAVFLAKPRERTLRWRKRCLTTWKGCST